jgi:hemoglobin/transferrin/lactoferrin receptor protein
MRLQPGILFAAIPLTSALADPPEAPAEGSAAGGGAPEPAVEQLADVIVTATRQESPRMDVPYSAERIPGSVLRREQMAASLPEALLRTPGVLVQQTSRGQGSPYVRGFTGFRNVALVDGIRLNNSTFRDGPNQYWSTVDALTMDALEVVKGPASVLYGSDAVGGAVNALMHAPQRPIGPGLDWSGSALYRFSSAERANVGRIEAEVAEAERWGMAVGFGRRVFDDLEGGDDVGRQLYTGYGQWDVDAKFEYLLRPETVVTFAYQRTEQDDVKRTHRTIYGLRWEGLVTGTDRRHEFDQLRQLTYARLNHVTDRGDEFTATVSWHVQDEDQFVERANRTTQKSVTDVDTVGVSLQGISPSPVGTWTYGVEHYHDFVDTSQTTYSTNGVLTATAIQGPVADDSTYALFGAFVQDEIPLGEQLKFTVGGRFTWAQADAGRLRDPVTGNATSFKDDWNNVVGSGRLLWQPTEDKSWSFYTGASQGFRAPNLSDLTRFDIARGNEIETAALNLKPEKFLSVELGAKTLHDRWDAEAALYHTFINDLIVRTPTGVKVNGADEVTKRNGSEGWVHGVELSGRVKLGGGVSLFAGGGWQEGEADYFPTSAAVSARAPLSRVNPLSGTLGLRWESVEAGFFAEVFGQAADRQDQLSPDDARDTQRIPPGGTPGWATLNLRAGYNWQSKVFVTAAIENILDEDYRLHGSGINQPGRDFRLSLEYRF